MTTQKPVVYLTMYSGDLLPKWYIGSTKEHKIIKGKYHGSVQSKKYGKIWNKEQRINPHLFTTKILSYHSTTEKALQEELRLQIKHDAVYNKKYINLAFAQPNGFYGMDTKGTNHPMFGTKKSKSTIAKQKRTKQSKEWINEVGLGSARKQSETKLSAEWKAIYGKTQTKKIIETKLEIGEDGLTINQRASNKAQETKSSKEWQETTGKDMRNKLSATMKSKEWKNTVGKEKIKKRLKTLGSVGIKKISEKRSKTMQDKGTHYDIFDTNNKLIFENISMVNLKKLSQKLLVSTKDNPLGNTIKSKIALNKSKKLHMIGWYSIKV